MIEDYREKKAKKGKIVKE